MANAIGQAALRIIADSFGTIAGAAYLPGNALRCIVSRVSIGLFKIISDEAVPGGDFLTSVPEMSAISVHYIDDNTRLIEVVDLTGARFDPTSLSITIFNGAAKPGVPIVDPVIFDATIGIPGAGDLEIDGSDFIPSKGFSLSVFLSGNVANTTITAEEIWDASGSVSKSKIIIPAALIPAPGAVKAVTKVEVESSGKLSTKVSASEPPTITSVNLSGGILTINGTNLVSYDLYTEIMLVGALDLTLTDLDVTNAGGTVAANSIVIPAALLPGLVVYTTTVMVRANAKDTATFVVTATPVISLITYNAGVSVVLDGTGFEVLSPSTVAEVRITLVGAGTLTMADIIADPTGVWTDTQIVVPANLLPAGGGIGTSLFKVFSNEKVSNGLYLSKTPIISGAVLAAGNLTLSGSGFLSYAPDISSVHITGTGAVTLSTSKITTDGGSIADGTFVIKGISIPGVVVTGSSVQIIANDKQSAVVVITL